MTARLLLCLMTLWLVGAPVASAIVARPPAHGVRDTVFIDELQLATLRKDRCYVVVDAAGDSDCSSGGGTILNICCSNGTAWFAVGDGAGAGTYDLNVSGDAGPAQIITDAEVLVVSGGQSIDTLMIAPDEVSIRVTANSIRADELAATITFATGDVVVLPINAANQTTDGQLDYDTVSERLELGDDGVATHEFLPLTQWDTESEFEALLGAINILIETEIDASSELAAIMDDETGTGLLVFGTTPTLTTPVISGAISFPDNVRQTFNPGATVSGLNVGALAGDVSTPVNGDIWYDSTANQYKCRENGVTVPCVGGTAFGVIGNATADSAGDTLTVTDGLGINFTTTNDPEDLTAEFRYDQTLAGNSALLVDQCILVATPSGGGFLCEGSVANDNEQEYLFPDSDGADVTERIVTTVGVASRGSIIRGGTSGPWEELVIGISGTHLFSNGTDVGFFDSDNVDFILLTTAVPGSSGGISIDTNGDNLNIIDDVLQFQGGTTDYFIPSVRTYPVNQADVLSIDTTANQFRYKLITGGNAVTVSPTDALIVIAVDVNSINQDELAAIITLADGDLVDFGAFSTTATEGLRLPHHATDCTTATAEGQICWEEADEDLFVGNGSAAVQINVAAGAHADTITWSGTAILESGVAFQFGDGSDATVTHTYANTGTNVVIAYSSSLMNITTGTLQVTALDLTEGNILNVGLIEADTLAPDGTTLTIGDADLVTLTVDTGATGIAMTTSGTECVMLHAQASVQPAAETSVITLVEGTNFPYNVVEFDDTLDEIISWTYDLPENIVGTTASVEVSWLTVACTAATADDVCWVFNGGGFQDDDAYNTGAFSGSETFVQDKCTTAGDIHTTGGTTWTHGYDVAAPKDTTAVFQIQREQVADASCTGDNDDISGDVRLASVRICYEVENVFSGEGG